MPLDHFVSQVHLRNFYSDDERGRLVGVKKDDLKKFYPWSEISAAGPTAARTTTCKSLARLKTSSRALSPTTTLRRREIDTDQVYVIAGFVAYVMSASPTATRMGKPHLAATLQSAAEILDAQGMIPPAPDELGNKRLSDLLGDGSVQITIDEKYPQAIGISQIEGRVHVFGNALWDVMFADPADGAFFTSDFPIGLGPSYDASVVSKTVPLAPDVAVRIHPLLRERGKEPTFPPPGSARSFGASRERKYER